MVITNFVKFLGQDSVNRQAGLVLSRMGPKIRAGTAGFVG